MTDSTGPTDLTGRVALLTGASGGIGRALATHLAQAGVHVGLAYGSDTGGAAEAAETAAGAGVRAVSVNADLTDPDAPGHLVRQVESALGPVDILINNAGLSVERPWQELGLDDWDRTLAVNLRAPFLLAQAVLPGMTERGFGRVVFMSSVAGLTGGVIGPHYAASKSGLHGLVHFYATRVAGHGVTVNAVAPARIAGTGMVPGDPADMAKLPIPVGRFGRTAEVADFTMAVLRNGYLTNQVLPVDGGAHPH